MRADGMAPSRTNETNKVICEEAQSWLPSPKSKALLADFFIRFALLAVEDSNIFLLHYR